MKTFANTQLAELKIGQIVYVLIGFNVYFDRITTLQQYCPPSLLGDQVSDNRRGPYSMTDAYLNLDDALEALHAKLQKHVEKVIVAVKTDNLDKKTLGWLVS